MNAKELGNSKVLNLLPKPAGLIIGSELRRKIFDPVKTLQGAGIRSGQTE